MTQIRRINKTNGQMANPIKKTQGRGKSDNMSKDSGQCSSKDSVIIMNECV